MHYDLDPIPDSLKIKVLPEDEATKKLRCFNGSFAKMQTVTNPRGSPKGRAKQFTPT